MHLSGLSVDLNWLVQFVFTALAIGFGVLHVVKNTASKYFVVDANFEGNASSAGAESPEIERSIMPGVSTCAFCGDVAAKKQCSGCKSVRYCSQNCQREHWLSGHKKNCKDSQHGRKPSGFGSRNSTGVVLVHDVGNSNTLKQSKKILFPYDEFIKYFNWDNPGFPPCGLLNCGNSCFANVVLQCLAHTRPLVAYLLEKGHRKECGRNDWCFLCEFQAHVERASHSLQPFSPINILSRLPYLGGNLGYGKQEDAHEFMRFAIDTMQSVCLDEFGGEKCVHPRSQETTLIQHIFGGHLQSQVICTKCNKISNQYENMMDLTVEIQGDAASLEECLDQFTVKEWLHGENMYRCDGCNDYVKAWKRLTVRQAPNILTIALKRFQSGRFGKLNKRVTFPETLDLSPYMTEAVDGANAYKLYAVVVHLDMLNASYFGHYICYVKDFHGTWYRIDDCKVVNVELDEVLSQGAYMLLYSRVSARSSCLNSLEALKTEEQHVVDLALEVEPCTKASVATGDSSDPITACGPLPANSCQQIKISNYEESSSGTNFEALREDSEDAEMMDHWSCPLVPKEVVVHSDGQSNAKESAEHEQRLVSATSCSSEISSGEARELRCELPSSYLEIVDGDSFKSSCIGEVVSLNPTKNPAPTQNAVCGKAETSNDVSFANIGSVEESSLVVSSKSLPVSSSEKLEKDESGEDLQRPICTAGYSAEGCLSSGPNLKPLFPSGFLGKRPCNKSVKRHRSSLQESDKLIPASKVDSNSNGFLKPGFLNQKGDNIKGQVEAHLDCNGLLSGRSVQEPPENCLNEVEMVDINVGESVSICNGDTSDGKNARDFTMNDAEEKTVCAKSDDGCNGLAYSIDAPLREKSVAIDGDVQE